MSLTPKQKAFLDRTGVAGVLDRMLVAVVKDKPTQPWEWIIKQLQAELERDRARRQKEAEAAAKDVPNARGRVVAGPAVATPGGCHAADGDDDGDDTLATPPGSPCLTRVTISQLQRFKAEGVLNPWERMRSYDPHYRAKGDKFRLKRNQDVIVSWFLNRKCGWTWAQLTQTVFKDPVGVNLLNYEVFVTCVVEPLKLLAVGTSIGCVQLIDEWFYGVYAGKAARLCTLEDVGRYTDECLAWVRAEDPPMLSRDIQHIQGGAGGADALLEHSIGRQYAVALRVYTEACELPIPPVSGGCRSFLLEVSEFYKAAYANSPGAPAPSPAALDDTRAGGPLLETLQLWRYPLVLWLVAQRLASQQPFQEFTKLAKTTAASPPAHTLLCNLLLVFTTYYWSQGAATAFAPQAAKQTLRVLEEHLYPLLVKILTIREEALLQGTPLPDVPLALTDGRAAHLPFKFASSLFPLKRATDDTLVSGILVLQANEAIVMRTSLLRRFAVLLSLLLGEARVDVASPMLGARAARLATQPMENSLLLDRSINMNASILSTSRRLHAPGRGLPWESPTTSINEVPYRWHHFPHICKWWADEIGPGQVTATWTLFSHKFAAATHKPPAQHEWEYAALQHLLDYFNNGTVVVSQFVFVCGVLGGDSLSGGLRKALELLRLDVLVPSSMVAPYRAEGATLHQLATYPDPVLAPSGLKTFRGSSLTWVAETQQWRVEKWPPQDDAIAFLKNFVANVPCGGDRYFPSIDAAVKDINKRALAMCRDVSQDDALEASSDLILAYRPVEGIPLAKDLRKQCIVLGGCTGERLCVALLPALLQHKVRRADIDRYVIAGVRAAYSTLSSHAILKHEQRAALLQHLPASTQADLDGGMAYGEYLYRHGAELGRLAAAVGDTSAYMDLLCVEYDNAVLLETWALPRSAASKKKDKRRGR